MAKTHFLRFLIRDANDLVIQVREAESSRLSRIYESLENGSDGPRFFLFNSIDGRTIVINLSLVQAVRFLWEPVLMPPDSIAYEGSLRIFLRGRAEPIQTFPSPDQLFDLFSSIELGEDASAYPEFLDEDGEAVLLNLREIVWAEAPSVEFSEGSRIAKEDSNRQ